MLKKTEGETKLSIIVPKKLEKRATKRNRLKRLIREYFRLKVKPSLSVPVSFIVFVRRMEVKKLQDIDDELSKKIIRLLDKVS